MYNNTNYYKLYSSAVVLFILKQIMICLVQTTNYHNNYFILFKQHTLNYSEISSGDTARVKANINTEMKPNQRQTKYKTK